MLLWPHPHTLGVHLFVYKIFIGKGEVDKINGVMIVTIGCGRGSCRVDPSFFLPGNKVGAEPIRALTSAHMKRETYSHKERSEGLNPGYGWVRNGIQPTRLSLCSPTRVI